jgi:putative serine protease PepD
VVGITSQIESESGGNVGVGYAVPIDTVKRVVAQLMSGGTVQHSFLGVELSEQTASGGVQLAAVTSGGPASQAGLQRGDVIVAIAGKQVSSADEVRNAIDARQLGDSVQITVSRNGQTKTFTVKLATRPAQAG